MAESPVSLKVLYFAEAARRVGMTEEFLALPASARLEELQAILYARHPELARLREQLLWSVDEEVADAQTSLREDCVVGVLPPFSGG